MDTTEIAARWRRTKGVYELAAWLAEGLHTAGGRLVLPSELLRAALALSVLEAFALLDDILEDYFNLPGRGLYQRLRNARNNPVIAFADWCAIDNQRQALRNPLAHGETYERDRDLFGFRGECHCALSMLGQQLCEWGLVDPADADVRLC